MTEPDPSDSRLRECRALVYWNGAIWAEGFTPSLELDGSQSIVLRRYGADTYSERVELQLAMFPPKLDPKERRELEELRARVKELEKR